MTVVSDASLADACRQAFREMLLWLEEDTGRDRPLIALLDGYGRRHHRVPGEQPATHRALHHAPRKHR